MATTSAKTAEAPAELSEEQLPARLRLVIARMARRLRQEAEGGLSPSQTAALATLEHRGPLSPSGLAEIEGVQRPTATRMIARLEEGGLVSRESDPGDGRSCLVALTPEGRTLLKKLRSRKTAYLAKQLNRLGDEERDTLARAAAILERVLGERA
jgi:DNA-binding MarR family transcriptional regulator